MSSRPVLSKVCRACGKRNISSPSYAPRTRRGKIAAVPTSPLRLAYRPLTTTTHSSVQPANDIPPFALSSSEPLPTTVPPNTTPTSSSSATPPSALPANPDSNTRRQPKEKNFVATITHIHNLTAHATYTKQIWDPYFRKYYTKQAHVLVHDPFPAQYLEKPIVPNVKDAKKTKMTPSDVGRLLTPTSLLRIGDVISLVPRQLPSPSASSPPLSTPATAFSTTPSSKSTPSTSSPQKPTKANTKNPSDLTTTSSKTTPKSQPQPQSRSQFFAALHLKTLLKSAGKHRTRLIQSYAKSQRIKEKATRGSPGVRFVVREILTPFGVDLPGRVALARQGRGKIEGVVGGSQAAGEGVQGGGEEVGGMGAGVGTGVGGDSSWWKRRELRGGSIGEVRR